ncbi:MAG: IS1 family transposase [Verrucomicrobiia bacterium]
MNKLNIEKQKQIVSCLVEGNSLRATVRMTGIHRTTIQKLLIRLGKACAEYQQKHLVNLKCKDIQCDEVWSFVYAKTKNVPDHLQGKAGDIWTWTAMCADSKLICSFMVGNRDAWAAMLFIEDLASRLANRVQLTTDGYPVYKDAVERAFGSEVDYARLIKIYNGIEVLDKKYSSSDNCIGTRTEIVTGKPDPKKISTSYVERQNLTMRMSMRRFTRLTNAFSKKIENHYCAIALHFMYYNFCRIHQTLRVTPAMEAGISDHVWSLDETIELLD